MRTKFWTEYDLEVHAIVERIKKAIRIAKFKKARKKVAKRNATKSK
ncbi:MAG: hypothetical protein WCW54_00505 [Candidatus Paceibacterota bacterium]